MKLNVTIENQMRNEEIVEIEICNGNWKYWDDYMDSTEKESLTINTFNKAHYLAFPVNDEIKFDIDQEAYENDGEIIYRQKSVRTYDSLLNYLNCRIQNVKEDAHIFKEQTFECVLFDDIEGMTSERTLTENLVYKSEESRLGNKGAKILTVKIEVIE